MTAHVPSPRATGRPVVPSQQPAPRQPPTDAPSIDPAVDHVDDPGSTRRARARTKLLLAANMVASLESVPQQEHAFVIRAASDYATQALRILETLARSDVVDVRDARPGRGRHIASPGAD